jgi:hypothetical protein
MEYARERDSQRHVTAADPFLFVVQGDQKVCMHLMITIQSSGLQRLFDQSVYSHRDIRGA